VNRALFLAAALALAAAGRLAAQEPPPPPPRDTTRTDSLPADSARADSLRAAILLADSLRADSLRADSLAHADTAAVQVTRPVVSTWRVGLQPAYRRSPHLGLDPFRYALVPHWGLVIAAGASGTNNSINASDIGALWLLTGQGLGVVSRDSLRNEDIINAFGLVPTGKGLLGFVQGGGAVHLGGPFGHHFALGFTGEGRAYSSFRLDDNIVALLRDGNGTRQNFSLGASGGAALATAEGGVHAVLRFGATADNDPGLRIIMGVGARYLKPLAFGRGGSALGDAGIIRLTGDSIAINTQVESEFTYQTQDSLMNVKGSGMAMDYLLRFELPRPGLAFEMSLSNAGSVKIQGVERRRANISGVRAASIKELRDILMYTDTTIAPRQSGTGLDTTVTRKLKPQYDFQVRDTTEVTVTLPRVLRLAASAWVLPMLQLDASYTGAVSGDFTAPAIIEAGATLRLLRWLPLRVGIVRAGDYGNGFTAGFGIETRVLYLDVSGGFYGSAPKTATGGGARVEFGFFF
jgi:hypothetical protein